jgi:hydrogenase nickel incorporation protein HypA/HybF
VFSAKVKSKKKRLPLGTIILQETHKVSNRKCFDMHEWALAEGVISTATRVAEEQGIKEITEIKVGIGELQQIEHEIFLFALEQLRTPNIKNAKFTLQAIKGRLRCRVCGEEWEFSNRDMDEETSEAIHFVPEMAHVYIKCPSCESPDFSVLEGRGVVLASISGVKNDN